ncbi:MAG: hypothetical protein GX950_03570 [Candidatus Diapherotrites archaeon]|uniref:Uncharacterized protein n=1 Tax=Candidatus Iainarchaeum sp. TaxID=3101447 RepID=A0A7K4C0C7_9ARCH|nr:hypothetical protein [Candidatus Diapherotrites archaeon]
MIEVIFLVLVLFALIAIFWFITYKEDKTSLISLFEEKIVDDKQKLMIAERKFMQGKIRREVFEPLSGDMEREMIEKELEIFRIKQEKTISVEDKLNQLVEKMSRPTNYKKLKLAKLLKELEMIRREMSFLESKLLKREIKQNVFEFLTRKREMELIDKENQIVKIVKS